MRKQEKIGARPIGIIGLFAGKLMNVIHKKQYRSIIKSIKRASQEPVTGILDIGCGGGVAVKEFSKHFKYAIIYGIDHSEDMVRLSRTTNRQDVKSGKVKILHTGVENIGIESTSMNIITAFDTINFWNDYSKAFQEIKRVLTKSGKLYIINGYPPVGSKWYEFVKFKSDAEYRTFLNTHGFQVNSILIKENTIVIESEMLSTASA